MYLLNEEQKLFISQIRRMVTEKVAPRADEIDRTGEFPWDLKDIFQEMGLLGLSVPEEYGGCYQGHLYTCLAVEEIAKACVSSSLIVQVQSLGWHPIMIGGSEEQKKKYLPNIASGKKLVAFALTEANAGSDASGVQTTARLEGNEYVLNGTKQWITNAGEAGIYTVIAITDKSKGARGASAFIVEKDTPGFSFGKKENKMGIRASSTRELIFESCRIPKENLIGKPGMGFIVAMKTLDSSRTGVGAQGVGVAQGAFDAAAAYAMERQQFGQPIISIQAVQHLLADMATQIEAARALVYSVAKFIDSKAKDVSKESAMAKLFATDVAMKVTVDAVQVMGGAGYMKEYPVEKMMRDAKILQIYEGTNQIQRNVIGQALIKETAKKR